MTVILSPSLGKNLDHQISAEFGRSFQESNHPGDSPKAKNNEMRFSRIICEEVTFYSNRNLLLLPEEISKLNLCS